jgi:GNAT superfamily N-acetyltransferase
LRSEGDIDECAAVLKAVHEKDGYPQSTTDFKGFITENVSEAWVAELNGRIVGQVAVAPARTDDLAVTIWQRVRPDGGKVMLVERLFVHPEARKDGIAKVLLEAAADHVQKFDARLILFVLIRNEAAIRLYRRLGWDEYGRGVYRFGPSKERGIEAVCFASPSFD